MDYDSSGDFIEDESSIEELAWIFEEEIEEMR